MPDPDDFKKPTTTPAQDARAILAMPCWPSNSSAPPESFAAFIAGKMSGADKAEQSGFMPSAQIARSQWADMTNLRDALRALADDRFRPYHREVLSQAPATIGAHIQTTQLMQHDERYSHHLPEIQKKHLDYLLAIQGACIALNKRMMRGRGSHER